VTSCIKRAFSRLMFCISPLVAPRTVTRLSRVLTGLHEIFQPDIVSAGINSLSTTKVSYWIIPAKVFQDNANKVADADPVLPDNVVGKVAINLPKVSWHGCHHQGFLCEVDRRGKIW
jgi:hypothetical protein